MDKGKSSKEAGLDASWVEPEPLPSFSDNKRDSSTFCFKPKKMLKELLKGKLGQKGDQVVFIKENPTGLRVFILKGRCQITSANQERSHCSLWLQKLNHPRNHNIVLADASSRSGI